MPRSIKKIIKKSAFREEEVKDFYLHALGYIKENKKHVITIVSTVVIVAVLVLGLYWYSHSQFKKARSLEAEAYQYYNGENLPTDMKEEERYKKALELFQKANDLSSHSDTQLIIGHCYSKLGEHDNALQSYIDFIDDYPKSYLLPVAYQKIASTFVARGSTDKAIEYLEKFSTYKGGIFKDTALFKEAEIYENQENKEEAHKRYEQIVNEFPTSLWLSQAKAKIKTEDDKKKAPDDKDADKSEDTKESADTQEKPTPEDSSQKPAESNEKEQDKADTTNKKEAEKSDNKVKPAADSEKKQKKPEQKDTSKEAEGAKKQENSEVEKKK